MRLPDLLLRLRALFSRRRAETELDEELQFHLEMEARKRQRAGAPEDAARREARIAFGGLEQVREECRDARGVGLLEDLARDLRYGARALLKSPVFTVVAVLSLAVGIGANTWIFSVIDAALLRSLPVRNPRELVLIRWGGIGKPDLSVAGGAFYGRERDFDTNVVSWDTYREIRARRGGLQGFFGFAMFNGITNVAANGVARVSAGMLVSGDLFSGLGISTAIGRPIVADDDAVNGVPAAVIGYRYWQDVFAGSKDALGKTIYVNRRPHVIVGVARPDFPHLAGEPPRDGQAYVLLPLLARDYLDSHAEPGSRAWASPDYLWIHLMGRLSPPAEARARAELGAILTATIPNAAKLSPRIILEPGALGPSHAGLVRSLRGPMATVSVATGLTLLIACANLASLLLARATQRRHEMCLRMSLGASRGRVIRQLLCENAMLSAAGAAGGILLARWGLLALLPAMAAAGRSLPMLDAGLSWRVLAFTIAVSAVSTLLFGLAPAWSATRVDVSAGMMEDAGSNRGSGRSRGVTALVALQAAAALLLVTGASLLTRSLDNLRGLPLGFDPKNVVVFGVSPQANGYDEARGLEFYQRLTARLRATPGVSGVALSRLPPATGWTWSGPFLALGSSGPQRNFSNYNFVGDGYFDVMSIPLLAGRVIHAGDVTSGRQVAVVNEAAAKLFGSGSALGARFIPRERGPEYEVIGVVRNAVYSRLRETNPPTIYIPYTRPFGKGWAGSMTYAVHTQRSPRAVMPSLSAAVRQIDPLIPATDMKTLETQLDEHLAQERMLAFLASLFGAVTLGLACLGVYGMAAYSVAARTREIGIRIALGARSAGVMQTVLARVLIASTAGLIIGAPASYVLQRYLRSMLFDVEPGDPISVVFASLAVAAAAMMAAWLPARRALKIDPMEALRQE